VGGEPAPGRTPLVKDHDVDVVIAERARAGEAREARSDHRDAAHARARRPRHVSLVRRDVEPRRVRGGRARTHRSEHRRRRRERTVEEPEAPVESAVRGRVTTVERVAVIELDEGAPRRLRVAGPPRHRLAPRHPKVVVELAVREKRALARIPERVAGVAALETLHRERPSRVSRVRGERRPSPLRERLQRLELASRRVRREVPRSFTPDEQLVHELVGARARNERGLPRDAERRHMPVMQVRRESARPVLQRIVAPTGVAPETLAAKCIPALVAGA
jgi:hypothetical protein